MLAKKANVVECWPALLLLLLLLDHTIVVVVEKYLFTFTAYSVGRGGFRNGHACVFVHSQCIT